MGVVIRVLYYRVANFKKNIMLMLRRGWGALLIFVFALICLLEYKIILKLHVEPLRLQFEKEKLGRFQQLLSGGIPSNPAARHGQEGDSPSFQKVGDSLKFNAGELDIFDKKIHDFKNVTPFLHKREGIMKLDSLVLPPSNSMELSQREFLIAEQEKKSGKLWKGDSELSPQDEYFLKYARAAVKDIDEERREGFINRLWNMLKSTLNGEEQYNESEVDYEPLVEHDYLKSRKLTPYEAAGNDIMLTLRTTQAQHQKRLPLLMDTWLTKVNRSNVFLMTDGKDPVWQERVWNAGKFHQPA